MRREGRYRISAFPDLSSWPRLLKFNSNVAFVWIFF